MDLAILVGGTAAALLVLALVEVFSRRAAGRAAADPGRRARPQAGQTSVRDGLARTREQLAARLATAFGRGDGARFDHLEEALVAVDVGVRTAQGLVDGLRQESAPADHATLMRAVRKEMLAILRVDAPIARADGCPRVILVTGVNGVGKTTTVAKLAARYKNAGQQVLLVAADTFRAAAADQLEVWGGRLGVDVVRHRDGGTPAAVVFDGMAAALARGVDVVLVDTAGRLHTRKSLVDELRKLRRVIAEAVPGAPHETLLVLDATTGQNALSQARTFTEAVDVSGIVLTKLDGTARGGVALAIAYELRLPIRYVGIGEGAEDLRPFDPEEFVSGLLGGATAPTPAI